jgi:hypothetical protein
MRADCYKKIFMTALCLIFNNVENLAEKEEIPKDEYPEGSRAEHQNRLEVSERHTQL